MDDKKLNEYLEKLPQNVQDFVAEGVWEQKTLEVGKKYGLSETQTDDLANIVVLVLTGIQKPETFLQTITADLGISNLLAQQIMNDLETRVFEYALKQLGSEKVKMESKNEQIQPKPKIESKIPEVKPSNLPMVEKGETVHINKPPTTPPVAPPTTPIQKIVYKPVTQVPRPTEQPTPIIKEMIQRPVSVPRFEINRDLKFQTQAQSNDIIENKLKSVTSGTSEAPKSEEKPKPVPEPVNRYKVDPYREPME